MQPHNKSKRPDKSRDQVEFNLPNENRAFRLHIETTRCRCGGMPSLMKRMAGRDSLKAEFQVKCGFGGSHSEDSYHHSEPTPWFDNSQDAVQHWKVVAALNRT